MEAGHSRSQKPSTETRTVGSQLLSATVRILSARSSTVRPVVSRLVSVVIAAAFLVALYQPLKRGWQDQAAWSTPI